MLHKNLIELENPVQQGCMLLVGKMVRLTMKRIVERFVILIHMMDIGMNPPKKEHFDPSKPDRWRHQTDCDKTN